MTMEIGVDVTKMNDKLFDILTIVEYCVTVWGGEGSIITSTNEGENGRFADRHNVLIVKIKRAKNVSLVCGKLAAVLAPNYNIVKDKGLIRIKWDPKREKGNEKCQ
ncbi:hypothetical protein ES703_11204 [subsurface metagenome]